MIRRPELPASSLRLESSGFPSPVDDYSDCGISLDHALIDHPAATFFFRAAGNDLVSEGIYDGDLLIVDRSLTPQQRQLVVAVVDGELVIRRATDLTIEGQQERDVSLWGTIRWTIHQP